MHSLLLQRPQQRQGPHWRRHWHHHRQRRRQMPERASSRAGPGLGAKGSLRARASWGMRGRSTDYECRCGPSYWSSAPIFALHSVGRLRMHECTIITAQELQRQELTATIDSSTTKHYSYIVVLAMSSTDSTTLKRYYEYSLYRYPFDNGPLKPMGTHPRST